MDQEALRKQLYEEIQTQFDAKLREAKRQKSQLEEEIELSSEKWRTERRRLNSEIDRLESALGEARQTGRKAPGAKPGSRPVDPQEIARVNAAADDKIRRAAKEWESERAKLQAEVLRLQSGIAELIERSNNPLRANQIERERMESKYEEALRARRQAESALLAAKAEWEEEKLKLVGDTMKLRRSPGAVKAPSVGDDTVDKQLKEAARLREAMAEDLEKARYELSKLKQSQEAQLKDLTAKLEKARTEAMIFSDRADEARKSAGKERAELEKQLRELADTREKLERELERARQEAPGSGGSESEEVARLRQELAIARAQQNGDASIPTAELSRLQADLEEAQEEIKRLERHLAESRDSVGTDVVNQLRREYDERIVEIIQERDRLSEELKMGATVSSNGTHGNSLDTTTLDAEVRRIEVMIEEIAKLIDDPETELSTVIRKNVQRAELDAYLKGILFSLGRGQAL